MTWPAPITLRGERATLEPLSQQHHDGLVAAVNDGELWRLWYTSVPSPAQMRAAIEGRLAQQADGQTLPFAIRDNASGEIVGMSTYMHIDALNRRVEIGATWYAQRVQRSGMNTECKRLMLGHAFEQLDCIAVELRTHYFNQQSRRAIERLGAKLDGILRNHQRLPNGSLRDTCVYSITATEWPSVKAHLDWQLRKPRA